MDMAERVARALLAASDGNPPTWEEARPSTRFGFMVLAKAAIRAMLEGQEPVAWRYDDDGEIWACAVEPEPIVWDDWTETPLYDLSALKEAIQ